MLTEDMENTLTEALSESNGEVIAEKKLCDSCLGRLFGKVGTGSTNTARGLIIRNKLQMLECEVSSCQLCAGLVFKINKLADIALESLKERDYSTFLVGTKFDPEVIENEESLWAEVGVSNAEPIKAEFNREIGKLMEQKNGKQVDFLNPDIVTIIDTLYESVNLQISPTFIYGRYKKLSRGIPQTRWPCNKCHGKGCSKCGGTGKMYQTSVEEQVGQIALEMTGGKDHRFHGMGREDIDALMLGNGRPFVLEIKEPRLRFIDLPVLEEKVNKSTKDIEISGLRSSNGNEVVAIKEARHNKKYRVNVHFDKPLSEEKLYEVVGSLGGNLVAQRTPKRVAHRRADRERKRKIMAVEANLLSPQDAEIIITAEAGTYIKEFVNGDGGRTVPSISEELGVGCEVNTLDVLKILDDSEE